jgi:hypothetical protein
MKEPFGLSFQDIGRIDLVVLFGLVVIGGKNN